MNQSRIGRNRKTIRYVTFVNVLICEFVFFPFLLSTFFGGVENRETRETSITNSTTNGGMHGNRRYVSRLHRFTGTTDVVGKRMTSHTLRCFIRPF